MSHGARRIQVLPLELRHPFAIAHGISSVRETVVLEVDGGAGEAATVPYLGEGTVDTLAALEELAPHLESRIRAVEEIRVPPHVSSRAAACAADMALFDGLGKALGRPLWDLVGAPEPLPFETSLTIAMGTPDEMAARVREMPATIYKVKVGGPHDEEALEAIRGVTNARIRLDANGGWSPERAVEIIPRLERFDIEMVEQPIATSDDASLGRLKGLGIGVPIFADESVARLADVDRIAPHVDGIVVKLRKCGGVRATVEVMQRARALGLRVMIGCMIESSLAVTAAAHLAGMCDLVDLDAPQLIRNDPFLGVTYQGSQCRVPSGAGIGAVRRDVQV